MLAMRPIFQYSSSLHYQTRIATWPYGYHVVATDLNDPTQYDIIEHPPLHETFGIFTLTSPPEEEREATYVGSIVKSNECTVDVPLNLSVIHNTIPGETILSFDFDETVSSDATPIVQTSYLPNDIRPLTKRRMTAAQCQIDNQNPAQRRRSNTIVPPPIPQFIPAPQNEPFIARSAFTQPEITISKSALDDAIAVAQTNALGQQQAQPFQATPTSDLIQPILGGPAPADEICKIGDSNTDPSFLNNMANTRAQFQEQLTVLEAQQRQDRRAFKIQIQEEQRQLGDEEDRGELERQQRERQERLQQQQERQKNDLRLQYDQQREYNRQQQVSLNDLNENDVEMADIQASGSSDGSFSSQTLQVEPNDNLTIAPQQTSSQQTPSPRREEPPPNWKYTVDRLNLESHANDNTFKIEDYSTSPDGDLEWLNLIFTRNAQLIMDKYNKFTNRTGFFAYPPDMFIIFLNVFNNLFRYATIDQIFVACLAYPEVGDLKSSENLQKAIDVSKLFGDDLAVVFNKLFHTSIKRTSDPKLREIIGPEDYKHYIELAQTLGTQESRGKLRTDLITNLYPNTTKIASFIVKDRVLIQIDVGTLRGGTLPIRSKPFDDYEVDFGPYPVRDRIIREQNRYVNLKLQQGTSYNKVELYKGPKFLYDDY